MGPICIRGEFTLGEIFVTQIFGILGIALFPVIWIGIIFWGIIRIIEEPKDIKDKVLWIIKNFFFSVRASVLSILVSYKELFAKITRITKEIRGRRPPDPNATRDVYVSLFHHARPRLLPGYQNSYTYAPLSGEHEIRLLEIYPSSFNDRLWANIIKVNLLWRPTYDALSYTWADETGDAELSSEVQCVPICRLLRCNGPSRRLFNLQTQSLLCTPWSISLLVRGPETHSESFGNEAKILS
jgi:hypothetical protein